MALTQKHLTDFCMGGTTNQHCKYLDSRYTATSVVHVCTKHTPKAFEKLEKNRNSGGGWGGMWGRVSLPMSDNCDGYPLLLHTPQGVDVDKK